VLAATCGEAGVNILGLQVFPGVESVTDELVLSTPDDWVAADLADLIGRSGGLSVSAGPCTEAALTDQPTRYVQAARSILAQPAAFPEVVARLFDAESEPASGIDTGPVQSMDVMEMTVGDVEVQVRRTAPFTATEHARGAAIANLVTDVIERGPLVPVHTRRVGAGATPEYVADSDSVSAMIDGQAVGLAVVRPAAEEPDVRPVTLRVDPAWQRRGIGTRLLVDSARLANALGATEILLTTRSDNQAVLPMVMAAGLRGRIRMASDTLTVRVPVRDLKPLRT
jgi:ribosomal protein S18 acetylase RimI-like enzyme